MLMAIISANIKIQMIKTQFLLDFIGKCIKKVVKLDDRNKNACNWLIFRHATVDK